MIWLGETSSPRSSPAIMASAMTPEPTVAIVRSVSGVISASIARDLPPGRGRFPPIRWGLTPVSRVAEAREAVSRTERRGEDEEATGRPDVDLHEAGRFEIAPVLVGRRVDCDDREIAAVREPSLRPVSGGRQVVRGAGLWVRQRVDQGEPSTRAEPSGDEIQERRRPVALDVAQPEAGEEPD